MLAYILFLLASFFWGTSFIAGKYAFEEMDTTLVVLFRFVVASIFWIPLLYKYRSQISWRLVSRLIVTSFLMVPATFLLQFIGLEQTTASNATAILGAEPLVLIIVGYLLFKNRPESYDIIGAIVVLIGIFMIYGGLEISHWRGVSIVLISTFVSAIWILLSKQFMKEISPELFTALTTVIGTILLALVTPFFAKSYEVPMTSNVIGSIIYLGLGCSVVAGWAWNKGLSTTRTNTSGLFLGLESVFGILLGVFLLGDQVGRLQVIGAILVVTPVIISSLLSIRKNK